MDLNRLHEALKKLAETVKTVIKTAMIDAGVKSDAHIIEDLKSDAVGLELVKVLIHDYYHYINDGARYSTKHPPFKAIHDWCEENGLGTENSTVFAVREAIFQRGLTARPFMGDVIDGIDDLFDTFGDEVYEIFCNEVDKLVGK